VRVPFLDIVFYASVILFKDLNSPQILKSILTLFKFTRNLAKIGDSEATVRLEHEGECEPDVRSCLKLTEALAV
jgi:hypothetical protein